MPLKEGEMAGVGSKKGSARWGGGRGARDGGLGLGLGFWESWEREGKRKGGGDGEGGGGNLDARRGVKRLCCSWRKRRGSRGGGSSFPRAGRIQRRG